MARRVFAEDSPSLNSENIKESFEKIERWLRYMQEAIEHNNYSNGITSDRQQEEVDLVVSRAGNSIAINEANIVTAINNGSSSVKISADHITLDGNVVMKSMLTDGTTQISGSNITTGTINCQDLNVININGSNVISAVANANVAAQLDNTLNNFASMMLGYVNQAMTLASGSANAMSIAGLPLYRDDYANNPNNPTIKIDFGNNYHVRFCPTGITLGSYKYYLIMNTPAGEWGIRTPSGGTTLSLGYTD